MELPRDGILLPAAATAAAGGGTFSTFLASSRRPRRSFVTVLGSILLHAALLGGTLLWGIWRPEELEPRRPLSVLVWHRPPAPAASSGQAARPQKPRPPRRPTRSAVVAPALERRQQPAQPEVSDDPPSPDSTEVGACPPGQTCSGPPRPGTGTGTEPAPALPPQIGEKRCLSCPLPRLPPAYKQAGISLVALVKICVDAQGRVRSVEVLRGISPTVDAGIVSTIEQWRYTPHAINGHPVPFCYATRFLFKVQ